MDNAVYVALSSQMALRNHLEVVANNLANASTAGFKAERMMFREYLMQMAPTETVSFVLDGVGYRDLGDGPITRTGNEFDVAINGKGYFQVETPEGVRYTRAGSFTLDTQRRLVTAQGYPVLSPSSTPLVLPAGAEEIAIAEDGTVSVRGAQATEVTRVGRIGLMEFTDEQQMRRVNAQLYATDERPRPVERPRMTQGTIEESNVQSVVELTHMIEILRTYQIAQKVVESEAERERNAIEVLGNVRVTA
jgi:flagellar basal-body rod protein FlgF